MEYTHNNMNKNYYNQNTNNYIVKVNSRDRNILKEPNPFNFKIKFNRMQGNYTTYKTLSKYYTKSNGAKIRFEENEISYEVADNGAVIEDKIEEIKDIHISEIVAPRYIPEDYVGIKVEKVTAVTNPNDTCGIFLKSTDNTRINFLLERITNNSTDYDFSFCKIEDIYGKKVYLFNQTDYKHLAYSNSDPYLTMRKNYYLWNDYFTDTLMLNGKIYKIGSITSKYIKLDQSGSNAQPDFLCSDLILPKYYEDNLWDPSNTSSGNTGIKVETTDNNCKIIINDKAESLVCYDLVKGSIVEIYDANSEDYHYVEIKKVTHTIEYGSEKITKNYPEINLNDNEYTKLKGFVINDSSGSNIKNTTVIEGKLLYGDPSGTLNDGNLKHLKHGVKDLLNEKLFYLGLDPITPPKNLITNNKLNNVIGTFYPSTQSKNYIFLSGQNRQSFTHRNLKNLKELTFTLYYADGTIVGNSLKNYSLDYLSMDCKQSNLTLLVDQVDRHFS